MDHQDWSPLVLKNPTKKKSTDPPRPRNHDSSGVNKKKLDEDEDYKTPTMTRQMGQSLIQGRTAKNLTQTQLAQKCNLSLAVIQEYEKGQGVYNRTHLNKICKVLGINVKK